MSYMLVFLVDQELSSPRCHGVIDHLSHKGRERGEEYASLEEQHTAKVLGGEALWKVGVQI